MKFKKFSITNYNADTIFCTIALVLGIIILAYARNDEVVKRNSEPFIARAFLDLTVFGLKLLAATGCIIVPIVVYDKYKARQVQKSN